MSSGLLTFETNLRRVMGFKSMRRDMLFWFYVSRSLLRTADSRTAIEAIVDVSRSRNEVLGVTGGLIFSRERFAQYLEGPADGVRALRASIVHDARHTAITTLREGAVERRRFSAWSLVYAGPASFVAQAMERTLLDAVGGPRLHIAELLDIIEMLGGKS